LAALSAAVKGLLQTHLWRKPVWLGFLQPILSTNDYRKEWPSRHWTTNPVAKLDVNGEYMVVEGLGGVQAYIGDDGTGNDVQVGSLESGSTAVVFYNPTDNA